MSLPDTTDIVVVLVLMLLVGGLAAAWGIARLQAEGWSWLGGAVAALGVLVAVYAPLGAMFGWPPLEWLRG